MDTKAAKKRKLAPTAGPRQYLKISLISSELNTQKQGQRVPEELEYEPYEASIVNQQG
jgi:hypothetical protein